MKNEVFDLKQLKFPIGKFQKPDLIAKDDLKNWIAAIENFPSKLKILTENLSVNELNWIYRPNGWKIKLIITPAPPNIIISGIVHITSAWTGTDKRLKFPKVPSKIGNVEI